MEPPETVGFTLGFSPEAFRLDGPANVQLAGVFNALTVRDALFGRERHPIWIQFLAGHNCLWCFQDCALRLSLPPAWGGRM